MKESAKRDKWTHTHNIELGGHGTCTLVSTRQNLKESRGRFSMLSRLEGATDLFLFHCEDVIGMHISCRRWKAASNKTVNAAMYRYAKTPSRPSYRQMARVYVNSLYGSSHCTDRSPTSSVFSIRFVGSHRSILYLNLTPLPQPFPYDLFWLC